MNIEVCMKALIYYYKLCTEYLAMFTTFMLYFKERKNKPSVKSHYSVINFF